MKIYFLLSTTFLFILDFKNIENVNINLSTKKDWFI